MGSSFVDLRRKATTTASTAAATAADTPPITPPLLPLSSFTEAAVSTALAKVVVGAADVVGAAAVS